MDIMYTHKLCTGIADNLTKNPVFNPSSCMIFLRIENMKDCGRKRI